MTRNGSQLNIGAAKRSGDCQNQYMTLGLTPKGAVKPFTNTQNNTGLTSAVLKKKVDQKVAFGRSQTTY